MSGMVRLIDNLSYLFELGLVFTTILDGWVALEEWKLRLTSAKVEVEVEAELGKNNSSAIRREGGPTTNNNFGCSGEGRYQIP